MDRRTFSGLALGSALIGPGAAPAWAQASSGQKVLRYAFPAGETGFDPVQVSDTYSRTVTDHIFEGLYQYDYLARPYKVKPCLAEGMPEVSEDFRTWTIRLKRGVFFAQDAAFKGQRREVVAQDFIYTFKRYYDPKTKSPNFPTFREAGILGIDALREAALKTQRFDYDAPIEGLQALDSHTLRIKLSAPRPRFLYYLAAGDIYGAVAREVVEHYGDNIMAHPVGTGPFKLTTWRRASLIVLERNPDYREAYFDAEPNADDAEGQAWLKQLKGRRLPIIDRVEVSIIEESQPRWLAFLNRQYDLVAVPLEFSSVAVPQGRLAPNLAKQGIRLGRQLLPDRVLYYFNMEDPVVGGYTPEKVALRRAIGLATDLSAEIRLVRRDQAIPVQTMVAPYTWGYDPKLKTENSDYDLARAKALLDLYGWTDRDGDGWREQPDGSPLVLEYASQPDAISRALDEVWKKNMDALGIRLDIKLGKWPEQLKAARAGKLQIWLLAYTAPNPDVQDALDILFGPSSGAQNLARFKLDAYDEICRRMQALPDGPERLALLRQAQRLVLAYAPHKYTVHRIANDLTHRHVIGYRRPAFGRQFWHYIDLEPQSA
ncbi:MAG: bicyclomycin resistance protein [Ideonella sp. MAG2]|nr:MAG: bicyclomycin resistance protein [Ideonella sp. MAG2]